MNASELARIIAAYLDDRDDIASAEAQVAPDGLGVAMAAAGLESHAVAVMTQGGTSYTVLVAKIVAPGEELPT